MLTLASQNKTFLSQQTLSLLWYGHSDKRVWRPFLKNFETCVKPTLRCHSIGDSGGPSLVCEGISIPNACALQLFKKGCYSKRITLIYMLLFSEKGKAVLHGIASSGMGCGTSNSFPGVSVNVFKLMSFVNDVMVITFMLQMLKKFIEILVRISNMHVSLNLLSIYKQKSENQLIDF